MTRIFSRFFQRFGRLPPSADLSLLYAILIAGGAVLLMLPISNTVQVTWSDAIFTSASAVTVTGLVVFVAIFLLTASHDGHFLDISFEVASAFGTVGLSWGYTGELNDFGRAVIVAIMFLGRVGPLTLGFFLATRVLSPVRYPEGRVYLG